MKSTIQFYLKKKPLLPIKCPKAPKNLKQVFIIQNVSSDNKIHFSFDFLRITDELYVINYVQKLHKTYKAKTKSILLNETVAKISIRYLHSTAQNKTKCGTQKGATEQK